MPNRKCCQYVSSDGKKCSEPDLGGGYCFWHDANVDKSGMDLSERLERFAQSGGMLQGVKLKRAKLKGIQLVNRGSKDGFDMRNADLYRADLSDAHLFNINLSDSSLMKAKLYYADLHCANLENANLLGVKLVGTRMDKIKIGDKLYQEKLGDQAAHEGNLEKAKDNYEQSEEIYRNLRKALESDGLANFAGYCSLKELTMRRKQSPFFSRQRIQSKLVDLFCGYGEKPINVIIFSLGLILFCALLFFIFGIQGADGVIQFSTSNSLSQNFSDFFSACYFSVVTFTTLGYGDIQPVGFTRLIATIEAFIGSFALALYVVVFVTKSNR